MCGRYTMHHSPQQVEMRFGIIEARATPTERYNIAPMQTVPIVVEGDGARFLDNMQWGLIPSWAKEPGIGNKMINARAETLAEKPAFRVALSRRRCIIPADGFYEWKTEDGARQPMHIRRKDGELFGFAGLWEEWKQPDGTPLRTCTIITTSPNSVLEPIHDRMPAMLLPEDEEAWLNVALNKPVDVVGLLHPYPAELMEAYAVDKRVNIPTIEDPALLNSL
jgi:putative SOS response-associated peptidase YedK